MVQLFRTEKSIFTDIVELVKLTNGPDAAKAAVFKYLHKLPKICPTPGCMHDLNNTPFLCKNYRNLWQLFNIVNGNMRTATWLGNALSTLDICNTLERCEDDENEHCRKCKNNRSLTARHSTESSATAADSSLTLNTRKSGILKNGRFLKT